MRLYTVKCWHEGQRVEYPARTLEDACERAMLEVGRLRLQGFAVTPDSRNTQKNGLRWNAVHPVGGGRVHVEVRTVYT